MAKVKVYTRTVCPACDMTKMVLDMEGVEYEAINIDENEDAYEYVKGLGFQSTPVIEAEGVEAFSGFQPDKLKELK